MMEWIQENTKRHYSQTEYGKNVLVVGDRADGENPGAIMLIQVEDRGVEIAMSQEMH
jgi:hypothetical protein